MTKDKDSNENVAIAETVEAEVTRRPKLKVVKEEKKVHPSLKSTRIRQERNAAPKCGRCGRVIVIEGKDMESYRVTPTMVFHEDVNCSKR